jgi:C1A family cysteine protease
MAAHAFGWLPDAPDSRDYKFIPPSEEHIGPLPKSVDLRDSGNLPPIVDQGQLGSCTANAGAGLLGYLHKRGGQAFNPYSRLWLYYFTRSLMHTTRQDSGASISDTFRAMNKSGVVPEAEWPYDITKFTKRPPAKDKKDSQKLVVYMRVDPTLKALMEALAAGQPVEFGINVYSSFEGEEASSTGVVPTPDLVKEQLLGGHALLLVGYDSDKQWFIVRNSWGDSWGERGYCYLEFAYVVSSLASDFWTAVKF